MAQPQAKPQPYTFVIERTYDVPIDTMWRAWSEPDQLKHWFGPKGCKVEYTRFDFRPGGESRYVIHFGGAAMSGKWSWHDIRAPELLIATVAFTDAGGEKLIPHPGMPNWPLEVRSTVRFTAQDGGTHVRIEWQPAPGSSALEQQTFAEGEASMQQGWGGSLDQLGAQVK